MFQFPGFASRTYEFSTGYRKSGGLPHSEIPGSTIARISPGLIAACHVLHRLSTPRHSPDALHYLNPHPTPATGPEVFLGGLSASGLLEPVAGPDQTSACSHHRSNLALRGVEPHQLHGERAGECFTTLSIPCVPIQTSGQRLSVPRNQHRCPTARRSHSQRKHHTMTNSIPRPGPMSGGKPSSRDQACACSRSVEHFIPRRPWTSQPLPERGMVGPGRFERPTSPLSGVRSNRLSYGPELP